MFVYGFWLYNELVDYIGIRPAKHRGDSSDSYIDLRTPHGANFMVKVSSFRMELFRKNPKCVSCDHVGSVWVLESHRRHEPPHLNLYHVGEPVKEWIRLSVDGMILMTKDHIIPRSRGGPTRLDNLQTMCSICNGKKGSEMPWPQKMTNRQLIQGNGR